ncbi:HlyD family type I secretion periplasmic adaptor subunit [Rhizobium leguminosarum]|uniref:Membrane fusion protein (MFP) family protein n=1 Tax=Rhizobium beringeri TaxID=3019934 RepID=A0ABY1XM08_9HYPH|nr:MULTISPECIES: HlyD family type I secretion periplasmic adaptor subunit [Rhizobium]TAU35286.1 HlyD family type I secretion periplasmic adaptor subunit [Rhizobium leguminosarum]TBC53822.1 HlyD family type I secretion periplasmic adaptor subunit [Rhizobium leguminosarum]TBE60628.1 HlyD family type I secretion periplasmic adaptor subunit [Rhizobium beringeri]
MDNITTRLQPRGPRKPLRARRKDQEFLPAALEILEIPPSPVGIYLSALICALVTIALAWAFVGRIDIIASAQGKIHPTGRVKVVQSLQTGKVKSMPVINGMKVSKGEVLLALDDGEVQAQVAGTQATLASYRAEMERRQIAVNAVRGIDPANITSIEAPAIAWDALIPRSIQLREDSVLRGDFNQLRSELSSIEAQISQKLAAAENLVATMAAQSELIATLQDRSDIRQTLVATQAGSKSDWLDTLEKVKTEQVTLTSERGELADTRAQLEVLRRDFVKTREAFVADNLQKFADAARQADDLEQKLKQAQTELDQTVLKSPIEGVIQDSSVTTIGQVVTSGAQLMRIVPADPALSIEAYLPNGDIGFVRTGQAVSVKLEAFPFTRYGTVPGVITHIAKDAIPEPDAQQIEADPARTTDAGISITGQADRTQNLVFPITVELERNTIVADGQTINLSPGMAVTAEIKTGRRRILEYVFSPIVEVAESAMHER